MRLNSLTRIAVGAICAAWCGLASADSYKWLCSRCGGTWWTSSPLDNHCPKCPSRTYGKQVDHKSEASSSLSPTPLSSDVDVWKSRREIQKGFHERQENFNNFMMDWANKRNANRNALMQRAMSSTFNLPAALAANYASFPPAVQAQIDDLKARNFLSPQAMTEQLADKQEETYEAVVKMVEALQGPNAEQALAGYWNTAAQHVIGATGTLEDKLEGNKWTYVGVLAVKPFDPQFQQHQAQLTEIFKQKLRGMGMDPDRGPFDPQKHLTPAQQRLRAEVLARGGYQAQPVQVPPPPARGMPAAAANQQASGLLRPMQLFGGNAMQSGAVVTRESLEKHRAEQKQTIDELSSLMTPETLQRAKAAADQTLNSFIGRPSNNLATRAEIDAFWNDPGWGTSNKQDFLCVTYYAVCVMSLLDPDTNAKIEQKVKAASKRLK